ncbi:uncharacterized protein BDZ99DRAFT_378421, partial [Mytilinidion resinicola]
DSICINQKNIEEKNKQIPLMDEIYIWATQVYIRLGHGNAKSDRVVAYLKAASLATNNICLAGIPWISAHTRADSRKAKRKFQRHEASLYFHYIWDKF